LTAERGSRRCNEENQRRATRGKGGIRRGDRKNTGAFLECPKLWYVNPQTLPKGEKEEQKRKWMISLTGWSKNCGFYKTGQTSFTAQSYW